MPSSTSTISRDFSAVAAVFEQSASETSYTVYEITLDGRVMNSQFTSKTRAFDYARNHTSESSQVYVYKTKCIKIFDADTEHQSHGSGASTRSSSRTSGNIFSQNVDMLIQAAEQIDEEQTDPEYVPSGSEDDDYDDYDDMPGLEYDLSGLTFSDYGRGYLLMPSRSTSFRGEKYLNQGWWNESQGGWFFRSQYFDDLIAAGATYSGDSVSARTTRTRSSARTADSDVVHVSPFENQRDLSGFSIETYGNGLIVRTSSSNPLFKAQEPYLLGNLGWWNRNGGGWFFQTKYLSELQFLGATHIKDEPGTTSAGLISARYSPANSKTEHFTPESTAAKDAKTIDFD